MGFRELIKKVQIYSGFSDSESKDALEMMVESLAVHLDEMERKDFASHLPEELENIALSVYPTDKNSRQDILDQFMEMERIDASQARKQISAAWKALTEVIGEVRINRIKKQLPQSSLAFFS